jgi:hypothetical protein
MQDLHRLLLKSGKLCKCPDCNQLAKVVPSKSYGTCRVKIWSDEDEDCFIVSCVCYKRLDYCYYHEKFGHNGNGNNGNGDGQTQLRQD